LKSGQVLFDMRSFYADFGKLVRRLDSLYGAYGLSNHRGEIERDSAYERMDRLLADFLAAFKQRYEELAKQKPPEH
jgi:hypothetical protein